MVSGGQSEVLSGGSGSGYTASAASRGVSVLAGPGAPGLSLGLLTLRSSAAASPGSPNMPNIPEWWCWLPGGSEASDAPREEQNGRTRWRRHPGHRERSPAEVPVLRVFPALLRRGASLPPANQVNAFLTRHRKSLCFLSASFFSAALSTGG